MLFYILQPASQVRLVDPQMAAPCKRFYIGYQIPQLEYKGEQNIKINKWDVKCNETNVDLFACDTFLIPISDGYQMLSTKR